jgi:Tol biopolymer transport system component
MRRLLCLAVTLTLPAGVAAQPAEKQLVVTITSEQLKGGVVSEITWDGNVLVIQGVFAKPSGELDAQYFVKPARDIDLQQRASHTPASERYWTMKSRRLSPTGLGQVDIRKDEKMPMYGIASQEQRMYDAAQMGGTQVHHTVTLGTLLLYERVGPVPPYDGEIWSWSPPELNRVAYVNKDGDLWIAYADGRDPRRILKGNFTLPAWSEDGQAIAVAERKNGGRRWEISVVTIPQRLLR